MPPRRVRPPQPLAPHGIPGHLVEFVEALRKQGISVGPSETVDAGRVMAVLGLGDREVLREGLACAVLRRPDHRDTYDAMFDLFFPAALGGKTVLADDDADSDEQGLPPAISVVDVVLGAVLTTSQLAMVPPVQLLRAGPGSAGPAVYAYGTAAGALEELAQGTLTPVATLLVGAGISAMELSALGTQWLLLCSGGGCGGPALLGLPVGTTSVATLTGLAAPQPALAVSPSAGFGKACLVAGSAVALPFGTDPFTGAVGVSLPISSGAFRIVAD